MYHDLLTVDSATFSAAAPVVQVLHFIMFSEQSEQSGFFSSSSHRRNLPALAAPLPRYSGVWFEQDCLDSRLCISTECPQISSHGFISILWVESSKIFPNTQFYFFSSLDWRNGNILDLQFPVTSFSIPLISLQWNKRSFVPITSQPPCYSPTFLRLLIRSTEPCCPMINISLSCL